jgi:hypothetical protein
VSVNVQDYEENIRTRDNIEVRNFTFLRVCLKAKIGFKIEFPNVSIA